MLQYRQSIEIELRRFEYLTVEVILEKAKDLAAINEHDLVEMAVRPLVYSEVGVHHQVSNVKTLSTLIPCHDKAMVWIEVTNIASVYFGRYVDFFSHALPSLDNYEKSYSELNRKMNDIELQFLQKFGKEPTRTEINAFLHWEPSCV